MVKKASKQAKSRMENRNGHTRCNLRAQGPAGEMLAAILPAVVGMGLLQGICHATKIVEEEAEHPGLVRQRSLLSSKVVAAIRRAARPGRDPERAIQEVRFQLMGARSAAHCVVGVQVGERASGHAGGRAGGGPP